MSLSSAARLPRRSLISCPAGAPCLLQAGDKELALRVYHKARREGCGTSVFLYAAAVSACLRSKGGCDLKVNGGGTGRRGGQVGHAGGA